MKNKVIIGFLIVLLLVGVVNTIVAVSKERISKYWQDIILKPEQAWIEVYGYNNESILAYNVKSLIRIAQQQEKVIKALKTKLDDLTDFVNENVSVVSDSNDIHKFIPTWPDYIELEKDLKIIEPKVIVGAGVMLKDEDGNVVNEYNPTTIYPKGTKIYFKDPNEVKEK